MTDKHVGDCQNDCHASECPKCSPRPVSLVKTAHELTYAELEATPDGTTLHFTNWRGAPSVPVTRVHHEDGNIRFANGTLLCAFPDELTLRPRRGLED